MLPHQTGEHCIDAVVYVVAHEPPDGPESGRLREHQRARVQHPSLQDTIPQRIEGDKLIVGGAEREVPYSCAPTAARKRHKL